MDYERVVDDLYGLAPGSFVAARDARAAEARAGGDAALSAAIKKLRRPTTSAWLANVLARERAPEVQRLLELGAGLREAQRKLTGERVRDLSRQRMALVAALRHEGGALGHRQGATVTDSALDELARTLEAALADPVAGDALISGRLTTALQYAGTGFGEYAAPSGAGRAARTPQRTGSRRSNQPQPDSRRSTGRGAASRSSTARGAASRGSGARGTASRSSGRSAGNKGSVRRRPAGRLAPASPPAPPPAPAPEDRAPRGQHKAARLDAVAAQKAAARRVTSARRKVGDVGRELDQARSALERAKAEAARLQQEVKTLDTRAREVRQQLQQAEAADRDLQRKVQRLEAGGD